MKRLLREPLFHFVLLSILLFGLDALLRERGGEVGDDDIVVSEGRIENLAALFARTWQRPPTDEELRGLVDDYVIEEALYREGLTLGVDRDDTIIRRRVRQKMEFVVDDVADIVEPSESELKAWLADHVELYALPVRLTFRHVYLNADRRGDALRGDAERLLAELRTAGRTSDPRELGDASLLEHAYADAGADMVAGTFGRTFAEQVATLPTREWSGPVVSAFGLHLVFVDARTEGRPPTLDEVREEVSRDWSYAQREAASNDFYEEVLSRYRVSIKWPSAELSAQNAAESNEVQQ